MAEYSTCSSDTVSRYFAAKNPNQLSLGHYLNPWSVNVTQLFEQGFGWHPALTTQ